MAQYNTEPNMYSPFPEDQQSGLGTGGGGQSTTGQNLATGASTAASLATLGKATGLIGGGGAAAGGAAAGGGAAASGLGTALAAAAPIAAPIAAAAALGYGLTKLIPGKREKAYRDQGYKAGAADKMARADRLEERGKKAKAEELRLKAEYGTADRKKIGAAIASERMREFEQNPFKAAGVGDRKTDAMMRAAQATRQTTSDQLRQALGLAQMRGQVADTTEAFAAAQEQADSAQAAERAQIAQMVRDRVQQESQNRFAAFMGYPTQPSAPNPVVTRALGQVGSDLSDQAGTV